MWDQFTIATLLLVLGSKGTSGPFRIKFFCVLSHRRRRREKTLSQQKEIPIKKEIKLNGTAHMDAMQQFTRFGRSGVMDDNDFKGVWLAQNKRKKISIRNFCVINKSLAFHLLIGWGQSSGNCDLLHSSKTNVRCGVVVDWLRGSHSPEMNRKDALTGTPRESAAKILFHNWGRKARQD